MEPLIIVMIVVWVVVMGITIYYIGFGYKELGCITFAMFFISMPLIVETYRPENFYTTLEPIKVQVINCRSEW